MPLGSYARFEKSDMADASAEVVVYILAPSTEASGSGDPVLPHQERLGSRKREFGNLSRAGRVSSSNPRLVEGRKPLVRLT